MPRGLERQTLDCGSVGSFYRFWLQDLQRPGGFGAAVPWHRSRRSPGSKRGGRGSWWPGWGSPSCLWPAADRQWEQRVMFQRVSTGSDVWICHWWDGGVYAPHHHPGSQAQRQDGRAATKWNAAVAPAWFQNTGGKTKLYKINIWEAEGFSEGKITTAGTVCM